MSCCHQDQKFDSHGYCYGMGHGSHGKGMYSFNRMFLTKQEKLDHLESYKKRLENEIQGIDEYIGELKAES